MSAPTGGRIAAPSERARRWRRGIARYLPVAILLLIWQLAVTFDLIDRAFLPSADQARSEPIESAGPWPVARRRSAADLTLTNLRTVVGLRWS